MRRDKLSRPVRLALRHEVLDERTSFFDYGCGRGDDVSFLLKQGYTAAGWDPHHRPDSPLSRSDVVNLGYVVNVIENPQERAETLHRAWKLAQRVLVVSARLEDERDEAHVAPVRDGWVTRHGTFQKFFDHEELGAWISSVVTDGGAVAAGLGVYYVFRSPADRERYLASRFRRPVTLPRGRASDVAYDEHEDLLQPLIEFVESRGRLPAESELSNADALIDALGSLRKAFRVVQWVTDAEAWEQVRQERSVDLLVHLALANFHGRPRWSDLPDELQRDVRAFFRSYKEACSRADRLLFSTGNRDAILVACHGSRVGKLTGTALYVHMDALHDVPALLRVYEGCARALVGTVEDANIIKLFRLEPAVSYLSYLGFEKDPHPALTASVHCELTQQRVRYRGFADRDNPPILHRKELFLGLRHPDRAKYERLTAAEVRAGLYDEPERIGTREGWRTVCENAGVRHRGHRLIRSPTSTDG